MSGILTSQQLIQRLRALRLAQGKSAQALADSTGIPRSVIANMESGRRESISVDEAAVMCKALGVDLRVVISDEPMPVTTSVWMV